MQDDMGKHTTETVKLLDIEESPFKVDDPEGQKRFYSFTCEF